MQSALEGTPVGKSVDKVGSTVKERKGLGDLRFVRRQEMWSKVGEGVDQVRQGWSDTVIGII